MRDNTEVYCQWLHTAVHSIDDNIDVLRIIDSKETKKKIVVGDEWFAYTSAIS